MSEGQITASNKVQEVSQQSPTEAVKQAEIQLSSADEKNQHKKDQVKSKKQLEIEEQCKDFWFSRQLVKRPCTIMMVILGLIFLFCGIVFLGGFFEMSDESDREFLVLSDEKIIRYDAVELAKKDYNKVLEKQRDLVERSIQYDDATIYIIYNSKNGKTIMTPENVRQMQKFEKGLRELNKNQFEKELCMTKGPGDLACADPTSVPLAIEDGYESEISQEDIDQFMDQIFENEDMYNQYKFMFDKKFSSENREVEVARSIYRIGLPLKGYKDSLDEDNKQRDYVGKWNTKFYDYVEDFNSKGNLEVFTFSPRMMEEYTDNQLDKDINFSFLALGFVTFYMMFHTRSVVIGLIGCFLMSITFPVAFFFYRCIFQFRFFMALHTSILFILMGIGADDLFVFFDAFKQAGQISECRNDILKRISLSYRRAAKAMLITSSTTIIAFLATAISKLLPIMTFGIFSAINIAINYILIITFLPAFLVWREQRAQNKFKRSVSIDEKQNNDIENQSPQKEELKDNEEQNQNQMSKIQMFFKDNWTTWTYKFRYPILGFFFVLFILKIVGTLQIDSPTEPPTMIPPSHFMRKALNAVREDFPFGVVDINSIRIDLVWGLKGVDQSDADFFDPNDVGELEYEEQSNFYIHPKENQQRLVDICDELLLNKKLVSQQKGNMMCPMKEFKNYVNSQTQYSFPVEEDKFYEIFGQFLQSDAGYDLNQEKQVGFIDGKITYFMISFNGNELGQQSRFVLEPLFDDYEDLMENVLKNSPQGLQKGFQQSDDWQWMVSEKALIEGAMLGFAICISLSFLMLVISTQNIIISLYAIVCICGILLGTLTCIWLRGWEFGAFQSMNSIIIIGLSVDYVVHLVNAYVESEEEKKYERTEEMLTTMGISVLGGGMTTLGAGLFLFGGKLLMLNIMGILVCATIGFSLLWALICLPAMLHTIGPQGKTGNLKYYYQKYVKKSITK